MTIYLHRRETLSPIYLFVACYNQSADNKMDIVQMQYACAICIYNLYLKFYTQYLCAIYIIYTMGTHNMNLTYVLVEKALSTQGQHRFYHSIIKQNTPHWNSIFRSYYYGLHYSRNSRQHLSLAYKTSRMMGKKHQ